VPAQARQEPRPPGGVDDAALRAKAEQLVSQTFFGTLLKQMRQSPWKSEMFSGGRAGQAYQQMFDQHLVEKLGRGAGRRLVDSLVKDMRRQQDVATPDRVAPRRAAAAYQQNEAPAYEPVARTA